MTNKYLRYQLPKKWKVSANIVVRLFQFWASISQDASLVLYFGNNVIAIAFIPSSVEAGRRSFNTIRHLLSFTSLQNLRTRNKFYNFFVALKKYKQLKDKRLLFQDIFTESGQGRFSLVFAMSACLSVCVCVCPIAINRCLRPNSQCFSLLS